MDARTLSEAMGDRLSLARYQELLPGFNEAMIAADIRTVSRAAQWCAQLGHESGGLLWMEEIADGSQYEGRRDLGNTQPGDGKRFKGRGPIQVTGRHNYTQLSLWAHNRRFVPTPTFFVDNPWELASPSFGFLGAVWYWTVARPQINAMSDRGDIAGVTQAINGGQNGYPDREARYWRAIQLGDRLLPTPTETRPVMERVLNHDKNIVPQETGWWCGPASVQVTLNSRGIQISERSAMLGLEALEGNVGWDDQDGTDNIRQVRDVLNGHLPEAAYSVVEMPNDPPSQADRESLWQNVCRSISAGYPVVANIVAPRSNQPQAVYPSTISPNYGWATVWHYFTIVGVREENGARAFYVADSGFAPYGYWCSADQMATLIPPKGYTYATGGVTTPLEDDEMAFTDEDRRKLDYIFDQVGPGREGWPPLGTNEKNEPLTLRDTVGQIHKDTKK